jgi:hypothetical protein|nr:hypothetical protein [uncultured Campylobacter sp.]
MKERANRKFSKSAVIKIETKRKYREMIFYFALLVTPKRRELRRKILAQIEHIVYRAKILLALSKPAKRRRRRDFYKSARETPRA